MVKIIKKIFFTVLSSILISSCSGCKDEIIELKRNDYYGNQLNVDGYYFDEYVDDIYSIYFLYENGVILYGSSSDVSELDSLEDDYVSGKFYEMIKDNKDHWGVFNIIGSDIKFERWYPGTYPLETYLSSGKILNDSTFHITEKSDSDGSKVRDADELYHFKRFSPKPDSTNMFIE